MDTTESLAELPKQPISEGVGKLYHRVYTTSFSVSDEALEKLLDKFFCDINYFSPQLIATFHPSCPKGERVKTGDNIEIKITGPWNGPVRVAHADRQRLTLVTLKGHLEAGKIHFEFIKGENSQVTFKIESFARSKDYIVDFLYDKLPVSRFMQREMWVAFCEKVVDEARKIDAGDPEAEFSSAQVDVYTEAQEPGSEKWEPL